MTQLSPAMDTLDPENRNPDGRYIFYTTSTLESCCGAFWYNQQIMRTLNGRIASDVVSMTSHFSVGLKLKLFCLAATI
jgi:hypothetical protein